MNTVFICDDEQNIREGLKCILDWEALGFTVCGEAGNGEEALEGIRKLNPSLVLLDIRMPKYYGTDIVRIAREQGFAGKFIILSGYADFTYAQTAIRHGVELYLTKPVDEEELSAAVVEIKKALEREAAESRRIDLLRHKSRAVILRELLTGSAAAERKTALPTEELKQMNLAAEGYQAVIYEQYHTAADFSPYSFAELLKVANKGNHTFEHLLTEGRQVVLLKGSFALHKFREFLERYERDFQAGSPLDRLFLAYGRPVEQPEEIRQSYEEAVTLCRRRFFCIQGQHTLGYEALPRLSSGEAELSSDKLTEYRDLLTGYIKSFNRHGVAETLHTLELYLYHVKSDISAVKIFLTDLMLQIKESINVAYPESAISFPTNSKLIDRVQNSFYLYEIIQMISTQAEEIFAATGHSTRDSVLEDILHYIDHNFRSNLKLETIAPLFGYNSAYLGKIFHKATGENFNSYVDRRRIEYSKALLAENDLKVYEIAQRIGYKNVDYFHKKFKKYVGVSPGEFRKDLP